MTFTRDASRLARTGIPTTPTAQALRDLIAFSSNPPEAVQTLGALTEGDGGGGLWRWDSTSTAADNLGTVLNPTGNAGNGRWLRDYSGAVNVRWFGAVGDGVTDDTIAIQNTIDADDSILIPDGNYLISGVTIRSTKVITSENATFTNSGGGVALDIGAVGPGGLVNEFQLLGHLIIKKQNNTQDAGSVGVLCRNLYASTLNISVYYHEKGIWIHPNESGCVYNTFNISNMNNNKWGCYLSSETSNGWSNQNIFNGGRWYGGNVGMSGGSHVFIDINATAGGTYEHNGNRWALCSFESTLSGYKAFELDGSFNVIFEPRLEFGANPTPWGVIGGNRNVAYLKGSAYAESVGENDLTKRVNITGTLCTVYTPGNYYEALATENSQVSLSGGEIHYVQGSASTPSVVLQSTNSSSNPYLQFLNPTGDVATEFDAAGNWTVQRNSTGTINKQVKWVSTAAPTSGTWKRGDLAFKTSPSVGSEVGWVCTSDGTPGTWEPFGLIGGASARTGWADMTGVENRATWDTSTVTLETLARTVNALVVDLKQAGVIRS